MAGKVIAPGQFRVTSNEEGDLSLIPFNWSVDTGTPDQAYEIFMQTICDYINALLKDVQ